MLLESPKYPWMLAGLVIILAVASASLDTVGLFEDEGIYEATAGSLAAGRGYRIDSLPGHPPNAKYPFAVPAWLCALKMLMAGSGPVGTLLLKLSNVPLFLIWVASFDRFLRRDFHWPLAQTRVATTVLALCSPALTFSTILMSEIPFALFVWLLLVAVLRQARQPTGPRWAMIFLLGSLCFYLRTAAVAGWAAVAVFFACRGRRTPGLLLLSGWAVSALPWVLWSRAAEAAFIRQDPELAALLSYHLSYGFHSDWIAQAARESGWGGVVSMFAFIVSSNLLGLIETAGDILFPVGLVFAGMLAGAPGFLRWITVAAGAVCAGLTLSGWNASRFPDKSLLALILIFYFGLCVIWPWPLTMRLLVPMLPVLIILWGEGLHRWSGRWKRVRLPGVMVCVGLHLLATLSVVPGGTAAGWIMSETNHPYAPAIEWIKSRAKPGDVVLSGLDSQWLARQTGLPAVGLNTMLSPVQALRLYFGSSAPRDDRRREIDEGIQRWQRWSAARGGRAYVILNMSLNGETRHIIVQLRDAGRLRSVFNVSRQIEVFEVNTL